MSHAKSPPRNAQEGFIAILLLVTIAIAAVAAFSKNIWGSNPQAMQQKITQDALKQAKEALLAYVEVGEASDLNTQNKTDTSGAILVGSSPFVTNLNGRLPCPNLDGSGNSPTPCGLTGAHQIGLFPWSFLNVPAPRDSAGECLWYAVDGMLKINPKTDANTIETINKTPIGINSDVFGSFSVIQPIKNQTTGGWSENVITGNTNASTLTDPNRVIAVIIAPNAAIASQKRTAPTTKTCSTPTGNAMADVAQYLESYSGTTISGNNQMNDVALTAHTNPQPKPNTQLNTFVQADLGQEKLNDQMIWITAEEFSKALTKRTAQIYAKAINDYRLANGEYPSAAANAGDACTPGLLQGFMPYECLGSKGVYLGALLGSRLSAVVVTKNWVATPLLSQPHDPDWLGGMAHYAVSQDCLTEVPATYNPNGSLKTAAHPCITNGARVNVGTGVGAPAIILMRGRALPNQTCPYFGPPTFNGPVNAPAPYKPDISGCLEDKTYNAPTVLKSMANPANDISTVQYNVPNSANSNDYMVQFKAQ
jgi:hypothetical protein